MKFQIQKDGNLFKISHPQVTFTLTKERLEFLADAIALTSIAHYSALIKIEDIVFHTEFGSSFDKRLHENHSWSLKLESFLQDRKFGQAIKVVEDRTDYELVSLTLEKSIEVEIFEELFKVIEPFLD